MSTTNHTTFYIRNLVTQIAEPLSPAPWEPGYADPPVIAKSDYANPATDSIFFSLVEGSYEHARINRLSNPASRIHGFVADFDGVTTIEDALLQIEGKHPTLKPYKGKWKPWAIGESLGGGQKMVWLFEVPVSTGGSTELADSVLELVAAEVNAKRFNCYDTTSAESIRYQHAGFKWVMVPGGQKIPADALFGILGKAIDKSRKHLKTEYNVPIEAVDAEVHKHWPDAPRIEVGAMTSLFWMADDQPDKNRAAQVRETGMACFSERAGCKFISWKELFADKNPDFVKEYANRKLGEVIEQFHYMEGGSYYGKIGGAEGDQWARLTWEQTQTRLRIRGLSADIPKGATASEVMLAREAIEDFRRISGAGPFAFDTRETIRVEDKLYLNMTRRLPSWTSIEPDETLVPEAAFPFIWSFLTKMWDDKPDARGQRPSDYFVRWLRKDIQAIAAGRGLGINHALVVAGAAGTGKTFLAQKILQRIYGVAVEAESWVRGDTNFNGDLVESPLWVMDDPEAARKEEVRTSILSKIKKVLVSGSIRFEAKYSPAFNLPIRPRVVLLVNEDVTSSSVVPSLDDSTRDKFSLLLVDPNFNPGWSSDPKENDKRVASEFPAFVAWMLGTKNPEVDVEDKEAVRWGTLAYQHPTLVEATHESGYRSTADEVLLSILAFIHRIHTRGAEGIAGATYGERDGNEVVLTTQDLLLCLEQDHIAMGIPARTVRDFGPFGFGRHVASMAGKVKHEAERDGRTPWLEALPRTKKGARYLLRLDNMPNDLVNPKDPF